MTNATHCLYDFYQILERYPEHLALKHDKHELSYQQLDHCCAHVAEQLTEMGIKATQRVLLLSDHPMEQVVFYYTLLTLGCTVVLHMPVKHHDDWCFIMNDIEPHWMFSQYHPGKQRWTHNIHVIKPRHNHYVFYRPIEHQPNGHHKTLTDYVYPATISDDLAMIVYTSGSSAKPKGVMLTHRNMTVARNAIISYLNMHHQNIVLSTLPFWFDYGLYQSYLCFSLGATLIQMKNMFLHHQFFHHLEHSAINFLPLTPNTIHLIEQTLPKQTAAYENIQTITSTGSPLYQQHALTLQKLFPNAAIYAMYGLTECKRCAYLRPTQLKKIVQTEQTIPLGIAMPNTRMMLIDHNHNTIHTPFRSGEIIVQGEHIMAGYWRRPDINHRTIKAHPQTGQRTLYTGDLAYINEQGQLCHLGRKDEVFKCKGVRISPRYIEEHLCNAFPIRDIHVFGCQDQHGDHQIVIYLSLPKHIIQDDLQLFCRAHLPPSHQPHTWCIQPSLPKLSNGKTNRKAIVQQHKMHLYQTMS